MLTRTDRRRFPILFAAIAVLALAMAMLFSPVQAQEGSAPDKPKGLEATASHGQVVLTWDDPQDDSITGYVILRRIRVNDTGGDFDVLVADTASAATTYTDDTVAASLTYTYRIKAINEHGVSERSRWSHIDTPAAPVPDKPKGLSATASHDSVALTWDDPDDDTITGYVILRRNRYNDPKGHFDELVADTGTDATTYTDDSVRASTQYTYRIKAINEYGVSERSRWFHIDTPAPPVVVSPPEDGSELWTATLSVGASEYAGEPIVGYSVWNGTGALSDATFETGGHTVTVQVVMLLGTGDERSLYLGLSDRLEGEVSLRVGAEEYRLSDAELVLGGGWVYEWVAMELRWEEGEEVAVSIGASVGAPEPEPTPPPAPKVSNNAITYHVEDGQNWISLRWERPEGDVDGYRVLRMRNSRMERRYRVVAEIDDPDVTYFEERDVVEGSDNYWVVQAYNEAGFSEYSDNRCGYLDSVRTEGSLGLAYPGDARATFVEDDDGHGVLVEWTEPTRGYHGGEVSPATGYQILRWDINHGFASWDLHVDNTGSTETSFIDRNILPNSQYTYKVRAWNDWGVGERSFDANVQTPDWDVPGAPKNLTVTHVDGGIQLQWNHPDDSDGEDTLYRIYRRENSGGLEPLQLIAAGYGDLQYVDNDVVDGVHYHYQVQVDGGDDVTAHGMLSRLVASGWD